MAAIDTVIGSALEAMKKSGALEEGTVMATVTATNADATITVTRNGDTFPKVRLLGPMNRPLVGDSVMIHKALSGWVCLGPVETSYGTRLQRGRTTVACPADGTWLGVDVTFAVPFDSEPTVIGTPFLNAAAASIQLDWSVTATSATGFQLRARRDGGGSTPISWIATDL